MKGTLLRRRVRAVDGVNAIESSGRAETINELEFQRVLSIPPQFRPRNIPAYFSLPARRIRLALSFRLRGSRIDHSQPGRYFYPLGARDGLTGIGLSVCAPFEMNTNRSNLVPPAAGTWNRWLLDQAIAIAQELLTSDWLARFGADAYLALFHANPSAELPVAHAMHTYLRNTECWPTRARHTTSQSPVMKKASDLVVPDFEELDGILSDERYLDNQLGRSDTLFNLLRACGALRFTVNSLVRLRCAGSDNKTLKTRLKQGEEANYHYTDFPAGLKSLELQRKLAKALDGVEHRLSSEHKADLRTTSTTLTADGHLAPLQSLQPIKPEMDEISSVPLSQRLHPVLLTSKVLVKLAQPPNPAVWVKAAAARAIEEKIDPTEREALYRYIHYPCTFNHSARTFA